MFRSMIPASMLRIAIVWLAACLPALSVHAEDVVVLYRPDSVEQRVTHAELVIAEAMKRTQAKYGSYRVDKYTQSLVRERLLPEMVSGQNLNVTVVVSQPEWEDRLVPVWIPIDMGLSSYRIGFARRDALPKLAAVHDVEGLKKIRMGIGLGWSSRKVLEADGFEMVTATNQEVLARMLQAGRFDYFPRGIGEVFAEYGQFSPTAPDLVIDDSLLLEIPLPTYLFVSPAAPRIALRLKEGMESMVRDGTLLRMVARYHSDMLVQAKLCTRQIIRLPNPLLSSNTPLQRKDVWFDPFDPRSGLCSAPPRGKINRRVPRQSARRD